MEEKRVTWAELYFDLVFVFAVTQVSGLLHHHHDWAGCGRALVAFVPVYWCWVGTTVQANIRDVDNPRDRIGIFAVGLCGLFTALALPGAYGSRGVLFGAAYWAARLVLVGLLAGRIRRIWFGPYGVAAFVTGPLLLVGGLVDGPGRELLWAVAAVTDLAAPLVFRRHLAEVAYHPGHLPERFGLFLLVALGESIVGIGAPVAAAPLHPGRLASVAVAFVISCALWWQYFGYASDAMRHAMETAASRRDLMRQVFSYGHLALIAGVITVAVGFAETVARPGQSLGGGALGLLYGGSALYLVTFAYTRRMMFGLLSPTRLTAAAAVLALLALLLLTPLHRLPALAVLGLLAAVLVGLNGWEARRVRGARRAERTVGATV
ncbi:low temperature requirement protein A [Kitasatospora phosalacinea]|uniref:Low temperature requirement protein A n=1 Tax=Kitasatospora phosalacinea TaxID=2065 RepID=A0A9W6Q8L6_9ACTN|nr:low temperature requirement protein A [Kitasatospora phosalacinea]GLW71744.1 low temperature requirement protein A [Kitasatospora phosalacinea]